MDYSRSKPSSQAAGELAGVKVIIWILGVGSESELTRLIMVYFIHQKHHENMIIKQDMSDAAYTINISIKFFIKSGSFDLIHFLHISFHFT